MASLAHTYRYPFESQLHGDRLAVAPEVRRTRSPVLPWLAAGPQPTAALLLVPSTSSARATTAAPPAMLDPVLTANEGCSGSKGSRRALRCTRVDLPEEAVTSDIAGRGTNVDFGAAMRAALHRIGPKDAIELAVGADAVQLSGPTGPVIERKVALPVRWIKGFTETAAIAPRLAPAFSVKGSGALRFLRSLPRSASPRFTTHVTAAGSELRLTTQPGPGPFVARAPPPRAVRTRDRLADDCPRPGHGRHELDRPNADGDVVAPVVARRVARILGRGTSAGRPRGRAVARRAAARASGASLAVPPRPGAPRHRARARARADSRRARGARVASVGYDAGAGAYSSRVAVRRGTSPSSTRGSRTRAPSLVQAACGSIRRATGMGWVKGTETEHHVDWALTATTAARARWVKHRGSVRANVLALRMVVGVEGDGSVCVQRSTRRTGSRDRRARQRERRRTHPLRGVRGRDHGTQRTQALVRGPVRVRRPAAVRRWGPGGSDGRTARRRGGLRCVWVGGGWSELGAGSAVRTTSGRLATTAPARPRGARAAAAEPPPAVARMVHRTTPPTPARLSPGRPARADDLKRCSRSTSAVAPLGDLALSPRDEKSRGALPLARAPIERGLVPPERTVAAPLHAPARRRPEGCRRDS
jgi:hypothetical protein